MFLQLFQSARQKIFQQRTIKNAFREAGLVPFAPLKVLRHLPNFDDPDEQPSASTNSHLLQPAVPETPRKSKEVQAHLAEIFSVLDMIDEIQSPTRKRIQQLGKAMEMEIAENSILMETNTQLRNANRIR